MQSVKTSEKIMKLVQRNPSVSLRDLAKMVNLASTSNVHYHVRRLQKAGLVQWEGSRAHINHSERARKRHANQLAALRKMSAVEQAQRIEMVAQKAEAKETLGGAVADAREDVIRFIHRIQVRRLTAHKIG